MTENCDKDQICWIDDRRCDSHIGNIYEKAERVEKIREKLKESDIECVMNERLAKVEEIELGHQRRYIDKVRRFCNVVPKSCDTTPSLFSSEVLLNKSSYNASCAAIGCVLTAIEKIGEGKKKIYCNIRPPGHHASYGKGSGFCVFNNVVIGAKYYLQKHPNNKVLIVDWDVHHGDGTESLVSSNPNIAFISFHENPLYPGTGLVSKPKKNIYNFPVYKGISRQSYIDKFISETTKVFDLFSPDIIFLSAGFDAAIYDPLGSIGLYPQDYGILTKHLCDLINKSSGHLISVLEGGYHLQSLSDCCLYHLNNMR